MIVCIPFVCVNMRAYFFHMLITLSLFTGIIFLITSLNIRLSNTITYTDGAAITAPSITIADPQVGGSESMVNIVVYSDFTCVACASLETHLMTLAQKYPEDVRIVWKDMPNEQRHSEAMPAAIAARCAAKQGKFWEFAHGLFTNQGTIGEERYQTLSAQLNLDSQAFTLCRERETPRPLIERTLSEGFALNITATPTLFINGERFTGSLSVQALENAIAPLLHSP